MKHRIFRHNKITFALLLAFLLSGAFLNGCGRENVPYSESGFYFNTVITITVYRSKDARVLKDCLLLCDDYEKKLSRTLQGSDIYRLNHSGGVPVTVSEDTAYLLEQACKYAELSGGRIDPTVAPLMDLWDFTGQAADKNAQKKIPAAADIQALLPHINYKNIRIDGNTVTLTDPQTQVDLGFIAKGFIADRLKESLLEKGVESALINLGGNILAVGSKPDGSPFEIAMALALCGVEISFLLSDAIMEYEWESIAQLKQSFPDVPVYTSYHPSMSMAEAVPEEADVTIGFSASYVCPSSKLFTLDADDQHYGFEAFTALLQGVKDALNSDISARALLYTKGLVV